MKRPVSITVIAIMILVGLGVELLVLPDVQFQFASIFGIYLFSWAALWVFVAFFAMHLFAGIGLLRCRPWARLLAIALYAYSIVDSILTRALPGSFGRYVQALKTSHHRINYTESFVPGWPVPIRFSFWALLWFGIPVWCTFIYFLWTRRPAFYAARAFDSALPAGGASQ